MEPTNPGPESVPPVPPAANPPPGTPPPITPDPTSPAGSSTPPSDTPPPFVPKPEGGGGSVFTPPPMPGEVGALPSKDERMWAMLIHLSGLVGASIATFTLVPGNLLLPLILWLIKREESPFVNDQGKECINFQITMTIAGAVCVALTFVCVGFLLLPVLAIYVLILSIIAAVKSNEGAVYRYPLTLRLIT